jgi:gas vesicle protein
MADRDDTQKATSEQRANDAPAVKAEALPSVESPSISPAKADAPVLEEPIIESPIAPAATTRPLRLMLRRRRMALLAASVTIAAVLGAVVGAVATVSLSGTHEQTAGLQQQKMMQQTIARLGNELSTLKTSLDAASKSAHAQTAQLSKLSAALHEKLASNAKANEALTRAGAEVTGSISAPQTVAPQPQAVQATPLPQPRPQQIAAVESQPRPLVVSDWHVRGTARGALLVEGHGDVYEVVPGAQLPGLGRVESIRRVDGRWIVQTPRGLIVSAARARPYFD